MEKDHGEREEKIKITEEKERAKKKRRYIYCIVS